MNKLLCTLLLCAMGTFASGQNIPPELRGTWTIVRILPTRTISCWGEKEARPIIGTQIEYTADSFRWKDKVANNPTVQVNVISAKQFHDEYSGQGSNSSQVSFRGLGINLPKLTRIRIEHPPADVTGATIEIPGDVVLIKNRNTIIFSVCAVYFEAKRKVPHSKGIASSQAPTPERFALLEIGEFHGSDVALNQPAQWIGVYCERAACVGEPTTVKTARVADPLGEDDEKSPTGTSVDVTSNDKPLFLVSGISAPSGPIGTAFFGEQTMQSGDAQRFVFQGRELKLWVEGKRTPEDPLPPGASLVLSLGGITQNLFTIPQKADDPYITVLWIGDLDHDGKPDLLVNTSWHYNIAHKVLWLSSMAKHGELVGQAAVFQTTGC